MQQLRAGLRERGHDARLFTSTARPGGTGAQADYHCFGTTSRFRTLLQTANPWAFFRLRRVLARFGYRLSLLPPLRTWRIPPAGVWFVPFGFLALWVGTRLGLSPMRDVGLSVMIGSLGLFALQGMIAGWVILGNYGFGKFERIIALVLTLSLQQLTSVPLFILGMLDSMMQARDRWGVERPRAARAKP
jgi:hypothetical protein